MYLGSLVLILQVFLSKNTLFVQKKSRLNHQEDPLGIILSPNLGI